MNPFTIRTFLLHNVDNEERPISAQFQRLLVINTPNSVIIFQMTVYSIEVCIRFGFEDKVCTV
jgi:hypothetical protein